VQTFEVNFSGVTVMQGVEFSIFLLILALSFQQCSAACDMAGCSLYLDDVTLNLAC